MNWLGVIGKICSDFWEFLKYSVDKTRPIFIMAYIFLPILAMLYLQYNGCKGWIYWTEMVGSTFWAVSTIFIWFILHKNWCESEDAWYKKNFYQPSAFERAKHG